MLIESHRYVGDMLLKLGNVERAADHYRQQLEMNQQMVAADPLNAQFQTNKAVALIKAGDIDLRLNRAHAALTNYNEALRIREQLSSASPQDTLARRALAEARTKIADAQAAMKKSGF